MTTVLFRTSFSVGEIVLKKKEQKRKREQNSERDNIFIFLTPARLVYLRAFPLFLGAIDRSQLISAFRVLVEQKDAQAK